MLNQSWQASRYNTEKDKTIFTTLFAGSKTHSLTAQYEEKETQNTSIHTPASRASQSRFTAVAAFMLSVLMLFQISTSACGMSTNGQLHCVKRREDVSGE